MEEDILRGNIVSLLLPEGFGVERQLVLCLLACLHQPVGSFTTTQGLHDRSTAGAGVGLGRAVHEAVEEVSQSVQSQIWLATHGVVLKQIGSVKRDGRMEVRGERQQFPKTAPVGIAVLGVSLARVVYVVLLLGFDNRSRFQLFIILIWDITEDLFIVIIVLLWLIDQGRETCEGLLKLPDHEENTADERGLVHAEYLDKTLDKCLDSADVQIVLERLVQEIQVERLL